MADDPPLSETDQDVIRTARSEIAKFHDLQKKVLEGVEVPESVKSGCSIELGHKDLTSLPVELLDVIKHDAERLALNQNRLTGLSGLGPRFAECTRLRYLVMRNNQLREFPAPLLDVPTLELLDLKNNKIEVLPEDLSKLRQLRVLSVRHNRIKKIPLCIANMNSLTHLATRSNPIVFPPKDEWVVTSLGSDEDENEKNQDLEMDMLETKNLKRVLSQHALKNRTKAEGDEDQSESNVETPRPARRKASGRFPIRPSASNMELTTLATLAAPFSPVPPKPPPVPSKNAARAPPPLQVAATRPPIAPLTGSERNRSNSESHVFTSVRNKRRGFVTRKESEPSVLDLKHSNRLSHLRGLSDGSALRSSNVTNGAYDSSGATSPVDWEHQRAATMRRLSSLPEGRRKSRVQDTHVQLAHGLLFAIEQVRRPIRHAVNVVKESGAKRSALERTFSNAYRLVDDLDRQLAIVASHNEDSDETERRRSMVTIQYSSGICLKAFEQLIMALQSSTGTLVLNGNPQYVRNLMMMLYAGLIEIRNACSRFGIDVTLPSPVEDENGARGRPGSPMPRRPSTSFKVRSSPRVNGTSTNARPRMAPVPRPHGLENASRSGSVTSLSAAATPFSQTSFALTTAQTSRSNTMLGMDDSEDAQFERIFLKLSSACQLALEALPKCHAVFADSRKAAIDRMAGEEELNLYEGILERCQSAIHTAEGLQGKLATVKLKEPGLRDRLDFWQLCTAFTRAYTFFAAQVKELALLGLVMDEIKPLLKPVQKTVKDVSTAITNSPWGHLAVPPGQHPMAPSQNHSRNPSFLQHQVSMRQYLPQLSLQTKGYMPPANPGDPQSAVSTTSSHGQLSSGYATPLPATPLSAALGPAALATVPNPIPALSMASTPATAYFNGLPNAASAAMVQRSRSLSSKRVI